MALVSHKASYRVQSAYELGRRDAYLDVLDYLDEQKQRMNEAAGE